MLPDSIEQYNGKFHSLFGVTLADYWTNDHFEWERFQNEVLRIDPMEFPEESLLNTVHRIMGAEKGTLLCKLAGEENSLEWEKMAREKEANGEYLYPLPDYDICESFEEFFGEPLKKYWVYNGFNITKFYSLILHARYDPLNDSQRIENLLKDNGFPKEANKVLRYIDLYQNQIMEEFENEMYGEDY